MKKFFALLLALAMILALSACGEKQQEPSNEGDEQDNTPAQTFCLTSGRQLKAYAYQKSLRK